MVEEARALIAHARDLRKHAAQIRDDWGRFDEAVEADLLRIRGKNPK